ncbi:MAG: xanthine dehydrogenase accessory protein XdhC [Limimaricola sp.]|uniref:xanthine dehydrogenase accessory protein XdhC n=1 Tax=Limimaricola sp. TaxID=2211665 RepID=UPI001D64105A|nr:xanthine dehydrogenase accessory protein XdhC [Limimaricola sp.]MBI1417761.1 xanthine dehydrogenase accessory protein XdhC [Limimaricola sp.]
MTFDLSRLRAAVAARGAVARVLVLRTAGSVPREAGTEMLVWGADEAGGHDGTIGGGRLEFEAVAAARGALAGGPDRQVRTMPLGPALGQCCGGSVTLLIERFDIGSLPALPFARPLEGAGPMPAAVARRLETAGPGPVEVAGWVIEGATPAARQVWIWGAGHVGRALVGVLAPLPDVALTWIDTGTDRFPDTVPEGVETVTAADPALLARHAPRDAEHLIVTYSHEMDLALCHALLGRGFAGCGLIGSATKWARFRSRLAALGHRPEQIARIACPIGDPRLGKHPQAIALGVAVALMQGWSARAPDLAAGGPPGP